MKAIQIALAAAFEIGRLDLRAAPAIRVRVPDSVIAPLTMT